MNKLIIVSITMLFGVSVFAQDVEKTYKPTSGDQAFELNFDPGAIFGSNSGDLFSLQGGIGYRKFISEKSAVRLLADLSTNSVTQIIQQETDNYAELTSRSTAFNVLIAPGYEKHFDGTARLSPFVGGEALIGLATTKTVRESGGYLQSDIIETVYKNQSGTGYFSLGVGVFAGADYYIADNLYLGLEFGYSFVYLHGLKIVTTVGDGGDNETKNGHAFEMTPNANANFRIGWVF